VLLYNNTPSKAIVNGVENALRNTSESNPGDLWKILSKFKRSKREDKIDVDELYEYFKI
jgi:hypothetical protein